MEGKINAIAVTVVVLILLFIIIAFKIKSDRKRKSLVIPYNGTIKPKEKKPFLATIPSWASALLTLVVAFIPLMYIGEALTAGGGLGSVGVIILIIYYLILTFSCFLIVKQNPRSFWYVPLICNTVTIIAFMDSSIWKDSIWIYFGSGLALSIIASIVGARKGKEVANSNNP
jgi:hypothetical protein